MPMLTLSDRQIQLRMGQCNVKRWVDDIMPLLTDDDPLGVDTFATHHIALDQAPEAYRAFTGASGCPASEATSARACEVSSTVGSPAAATPLSTPASSPRSVSRG